ncbi:hypothetical protein DRE_03821 [Drechslerella stenobrocha 248]|uniref:Uncharacterized protein n=1 Tax=Drechslerella stenobrocha 248 TaxID=1043628 RepID=W7HUB4_9PEZI|nr:hypothetical protein DRE_03821 [Drechslerella stenobrocha 248]
MSTVEFSSGLLERVKATALRHSLSIHQDKANNLLLHKASSCTSTSQFQA